MINVDFLEYLIEYAKTENLTKASKSLHISQSALTRAMQKVEDYIGVPIFVRTKNKLSFNDTGRELVKNAEKALEEMQLMKEKTVAFYNAKSTISIGAVAPGPMLKYGNLLYSTYPNKTIVSKVDTEKNLIDALLDDIYDLIFTSMPIENENIVSQFAFTEKLYISVPHSHFLSQLNGGVYFKDIDGQSFLVAESLGIWDDIIIKYLPKSKFFKQTMENLYVIINASTIPSFSTNITIPQRIEEGRINIPILDDDATIDFYLNYKKGHKQKIKNLLKLLGNSMN